MPTNDPIEQSQNCAAAPYGMLRDDFIASMRRLASGVSIVATGEGEKRRGATATAVCSVSADPPHILTCINHSSSLNSTLKTFGRFSINILAERHELLARVFSGEFGHKDQKRFEEGHWSDKSVTPPVLLDAYASLACEIVSITEVCTHSVVIGRVNEIILDQNKSLSLCYLDGRFLVLKQGLSN